MSILILDDDGQVLLYTENGCGSEARRLGHVNSVSTSYNVPDELLDQLSELEAEWQDAVDYARDCHHTAEAAYLAR